MLSKDISSLYLSISCRFEENNLHACLRIFSELPVFIRIYRLSIKNVGPAHKIRWIATYSIRNLSTASVLGCVHIEIHGIRYMVFAIRYSVFAIRYTGTVVHIGVARAVSVLFS